MSGELTRIISDLHFGERACRVDQLAQLRPVLEGVHHLVINGDTLDTRPGPLPRHTAECRDAVRAFFPGEVGHTTFLTGNHDADFSPVHFLDLARGQVFLTHGDVFFDDIVPWSQDAPLIRQRIAAELQTLPVHQHHELGPRLAAFRRVAASIPQRHQSERDALKYALRYLVDTLWPPQRLFRVAQAWRLAPRRAVEYVRRHRPHARFVLSGHTHRPGISQGPGGVIAINTGSLCPPLGGYAVDLYEDRLVVRALSFRRGEVRADATIASFPLAGT